MIGKRVVLLALLLLALTESASALPVFARRYGTSCVTCHAIIPKLNPFGIAFRNNGYRIPLNDEKFVKQPDVSLGAPAWKELWPKAVWPGAIPNMPPIAFRAVADAEMTPTEPVNLNLDFPAFLMLYFAGPAGDTLSYFGSLFLNGATNSLSIDRAYAQFRLTGESPGANRLVLKVGKIDTRAEPFSSTFRKTTSQNFNVSDYRAIPDGFSLRDRDAGIELWGAVTGPGSRGGLEYAAGIVQGTAGRPENNNFKDAYWAASYKFGGMGVVGSRTETDSLPAIENYAETSLQLGTYGYRGKGPTRSNPLDEVQFTRIGFKVDTYLRKLNLFGAVTLGADHVRGPAARTVHTSAFFAEADYMLLPWVMPVLRFEKTNFDDGRRNINLLVPAVNLAVRANVRVLIEGRFYNRAFASANTRTGLNEGLVRLEFLF